MAKEIPDEPARTRRSADSCFRGNDGDGREDGLDARPGLRAGSSRPPPRLRQPYTPAVDADKNLAAR